MQLLDILAEGKAYKNQAYELYEEAFPPEEKKPTAMLERLAEEGKQELLAIVEEEKGLFVGLAFNTVSPNPAAVFDGKETALLDFFAISPGLRGGGWGSRALKLLLERFAGKTYIFEVEMRDKTAPNAEERERRMAFYLRNGLKETGLFVHAYDTDFEILAPDGKVTYEQYVRFLGELLGDEIMERVVKPCLIKELRQSKK